MPRATRAVHDEHGIVDLARPWIFPGLSDSRAMNIQSWQRLAVFKLKVIDHKVVFDWHRIVGLYNGDTQSSRKSN